VQGGLRAPIMHDQLGPALNIVAILAHRYAQSDQHNRRMSDDMLRSCNSQYQTHANVVMGTWIKFDGGDEETWNKLVMRIERMDTWTHMSPFFVGPSAGS
jgi:hypothetical protein